MTDPLILRRELENRANALRARQASALAAVQAGDTDSAEAHIREAMLLAGALVEKATALADQRGGMSQAMALMTSQNTVEWYTPPWVLDLARAVLGAIDLDPASNPTANGWVQAARFYTQDDDGYRLPWAGRLWLNPPFDDTARWADRLAAAHVDGDVCAALLLVNSAPGYKWYERMADVWPAVQFRERMQFVRGDGLVNKDKKGNAKKSQTVFYFGPDVDRFFAVFEPYGRRLVTAAARRPAGLFELEAA